MPVRNILVPIYPGIDPDVQFEAALRVAHRVEGHINAVCLRFDVESLLAAMPPAMAATASRNEMEQAANAAETGIRLAFEAWRTKHKLASEPINSSLRSTYACWSEQAGPLETAILQRGRLSDLIVLNFPGDFHSATERLFDTAVFDTGRPVLLAPKVLPDDLLRHVVIAWNGSMEATRAVAGALPLLHAAEQVSVFTAPWRNDDFLGAEDTVHDLSLPGYLVWHGIRARSLRPQPTERSVGTALLRTATEQDATLLVMGAYTRSRVRQVMLGGVTQDILQSASLPVLMAH